MSFYLTTPVPKENQEQQRGTPIIVDGFEWCLVAKLIQYQPHVVEAHVECTKVHEPIVYTSNVTLFYRADSLNQVERFDTSRQFKSNARKFSINETIRTGNYDMSVNVRLNQVQQGERKIAPCNQAVQPTGATKTCEDFEKHIVELKKENEENLGKIDAKYEEKCAKLEDTIRKLEERLQATEARLEVQNKPEEKTEKLTNELEKLKVSESEASLKDELEHLKTELEVANRKVMHAETKVELMQRIVEETEVDLNDKNKELELAEKKYTETVEALSEQLATKEAQVKKLVRNMKVADEALNKTKKEKDAEIETLLLECRNYSQENKNLLNDVEEYIINQEILTEKLEKLEAENARLNEKAKEMEKEFVELRENNKWLEEKNKELMMTEEEQEQHYREMEERSNRIAKENREKKREYVKDLEKEVKELRLASQEAAGTVEVAESTVDETKADKKELELHLEGESNKFRNAFKIQVAVEEENDRIVMEQNDDILSVKQEVKRDQEQWEKNWDTIFGGLLKTELAKTPSYLERRRKNNQAAAESRARRRKREEKLEKEVKELRLKVSLLQQAAKAVDFSEDNK